MTTPNVCRHGHVDAFVPYRKTTGTITRRCLACAKARSAQGYVKKPREAWKKPVRSSLSAEEANNTRRACKHGHVSQWVQTGRSRFCLICRQNNSLRYKYGVTVEQIDELRSKDGGLCPLCLCSAGEHLDHCHVTGVARGFLCQQCNTTLGYFERVNADPAWAQRAREYCKRAS